MNRNTTNLKPIQFRLLSVVLSIKSLIFDSNLIQHYECKAAASKTTAHR